jgi:hypothetical protein
MAFEEAGIPLKLRAYLTAKGKELILSGNQNSKIKFFGLSDIDTNYDELNIDLQNGLVPSVTGSKCLVYQNLDIKERIPVTENINVDTYSYVFKKGNDEYKNLNVKINVGNYLDFLSDAAAKNFDVNLNIYQAIYDFIFIKKETTNIFGETNVSGLINNSNYYFDFNSVSDRENYKKINNYHLNNVNNIGTLTQQQIPFKSPFILTPTHRNINNVVYHGAGSLFFFYYPFDRYGYTLNRNLTLLYDINAIENNYSDLIFTQTPVDFTPEGSGGAISDPGLFSQNNYIELAVNIDGVIYSSVNNQLENPDNNGSNDILKRYGQNAWEAGKQKMINFFEYISPPSDPISTLSVNMKVKSSDINETIDNGNITLNFNFDKNPLNWNKNNPIIEYI